MLFTLFVMSTLTTSTGKASLSACERLYLFRSNSYNFQQGVRLPFTDEQYTTLLSNAVVGATVFVFTAYRAKLSCFCVTRDHLLFSCQFTAFIHTCVTMTVCILTARSTEWLTSTVGVFKIGVVRGRGLALNVKYGVIVVQGSSTGLDIQNETVLHFLKQIEKRRGPHFSIVTAAHFCTNWNLAKVLRYENWKIAAF